MVIYQATMLRTVARERLRHVGDVVVQAYPQPHLPIRATFHPFVEHANRVEASAPNQSRRAENSVSPNELLERRVTADYLVGVPVPVYPALIPIKIDYNGRRIDQTHATVPLHYTHSTLQVLREPKVVVMQECDTVPLRELQTPVPISHHSYVALIPVVPKPSVLKRGDCAGSVIAGGIVHHQHLVVPKRLA